MSTVNCESDPYSLTPGFRPVNGRRLFQLTLEPPVEPRGTVIYLQPFGEEMHKSRRMAALAARQMVMAGWRVLMPDLYGCGDSEGDHGEASWEAWCDDIRALAAEQAGPLRLWGLRTGALMAAQVAESVRPQRLHLWQPVTAGEQFLNQFLMLRVARDALHGGKQAVSRDDLRRKLREGETLEVAGIAVSPALAAALDSARLADTRPGCPVDWLEVSSVGGERLPPAAGRQVESWRAAGVEVEPRLVKGNAFWMAQEIVELPALLDATRAMVEA